MLAGYTFLSLLRKHRATAGRATPYLILRLNENIYALGAAIEEIGIRIDQRGSTDVSARIEQQLSTLHKNANVIAEAMAVLIVRWTLESEINPDD